MLNKNILLYGHEELPPPPLPLRAGPLTMIFEPETAFLRYIRVGDHELVRSIYAVVRDQEWNTIAWRVHNLRSDVRPDSFDLSFDVECRERGVDYVWQGRVSGNADGVVTFSFDGAARSAFQRNRIGICVLHPIAECAGRACTIEHPDGSREQTGFPKHIAPWQPLRDVRAITHEISAGVRAEVRFEGDVFETEDQRQYGDMSFKTYSTPQELPKPVAVKPGDRVQQKVTVTLINPEQKKILPVVQGRGAQLSISTAPIVARPSLGVRLAGETRLTEREAERLRALRLHHLRADLFLGGDVAAELRSASEQANELRLPLHGALHLGADPETELTRFARELEVVRPKVALWIIYRQGESMVSYQWVELARQKLAAAAPGILVAAAAGPFFTEFNRKRPPQGFSGLPCFPFNPQVHLTDAGTLVENLADVNEMIATAETISPQQVVISPVTLKPSHKIKGDRDDISSGRLPRDVDARQASLFGAAWTLAFISRLALTSHVHSATLFETVGWRGLMETEGAARLPEQFFSIPGAVFPVYHVLADLADHHRACATHSTHPLQVEGLTLLDPQNRRRILVANLLPEAQEIKIKAGTGQGRVRRLNAGNAEEAMRAPEAFRQQAGDPIQSVSGKIELRMEPYEIARVDL